MSFESVEQQQQSQVSTLARTFCKTYCEHQEVRLAACYAASNGDAVPIAGPTAPLDLAWWLATYNNSLTASSIGTAIQSGDEAAVATFGSIMDVMSFATCLVPEIAAGTIQTAAVSGELFVQWAKSTTAVEELFSLTMESLNIASIVLEAADVHSVMSVVMRLVNTHCFKHASQLLGVLLAHIRNHAVIDAGCEKAISELHNLLINDFINKVQFESWSRKANAYLKDARFELQPQSNGAAAADAPTVKALKTDLLSLFIALSGDVEMAGTIVGDVPTLQLAGIATYIDPFATYEGLGKRAAAVFELNGGGAAGKKKKKITDPAVIAIGQLLGASTLAGVVTAMEAFGKAVETFAAGPAANKNNRTASAVRLLSLMVAAHVADVASPPFASPSPIGMKGVVSANTTVERYAAALYNALAAEEGESFSSQMGGGAFVLTSSGTPCRLCAMYMCWRPLSNPSVMKSVLAQEVDVVDDLLLDGADLNELAAGLDGDMKGDDEDAESDGDDEETLVYGKKKSSLDAKKDDAVGTVAHHQIDAYLAALDRLSEVVYSLFHADSPLQQKLRPVVAAANNSAAQPIFGWWDAYLSTLLNVTIRAKVSAVLVKASRYTELLIRSVACNQFEAIKKVLNKAIHSRDALTHPAVLQCGEAINYGLVDLSIVGALAATANNNNAAATANTNASFAAGSGALLGSASLNTSINGAATANGNSNAAAVEAAEVVALLHIASCIWDMTVGALTAGNAFGDLLAAARKVQKNSSAAADEDDGDDGDDADDAAERLRATTQAAAAASSIVLVERPFVDAAASLVSGAQRLADATVHYSSGTFSGFHNNPSGSVTAAAFVGSASSSAGGFEHLANSVRFTILQRLTNVLEALRAGKSMCVAGQVFGVDGRGEGRASSLFALLMDMATSIDTSAFVEEGVAGGDDAEEELQNLTRSLVEMGRCWC